jgi:hypothetical protein
VNTIDPRQRGRQRRALVALALLFFAPLALAFILYYGVGWRPGARVNHGDLVEPPVPLPDLVLPPGEETRPETAGAAAPEAVAATASSATILKGKWTLVYLGAGSCSAECRTDLYNTRQVRAALGHDRERVQRVFLAEGACCDFEWLHAQQPDLITVHADADAAPLEAILEHAGRDAAAADSLGSGSGAARRAASAAADRVYLVDPLGNLMMSYALDARPKGMLEDLKKLLRLSHVG